jgi:hypothetical protein
METNSPSPPPPLLPPLPPLLPLMPPLWTFLMTCPLVDCCVFCFSCCLLNYRTIPSPLMSPAVLSTSRHCCCHHCWPCRCLFCPCPGCQQSLLLLSPLLALSMSFPPTPLLSTITVAAAAVAVAGLVTVFSAHAPAVGGCRCCC